MNRNDDNSITYIAYKGAILLVLLILIFNADNIAPRIFLYYYADNNYRLNTLVIYNKIFRCLADCSKPANVYLISLHKLGADVD